MVISIVNFTETLADEEVLTAIRAINRQIAEDFQPYWSMGATLRLEGPSSELNRQAPQELRGDAIIYLWDKEADVPDAIGYHTANNLGLPYGFVFTEIAKRVGEEWSVTLSHEALELIGDSEVNILAAGPHSEHPERAVYFWYEMCDAVQAESYKIDDVEVSNFVLPLYFTTDSEEGSRNDYLGRLHNGKALRSFGINPGGYVGFFDPALGKDDVVTADAAADKRLQIKSSLRDIRPDVRLRRSTRYRNLNTSVIRKKKVAA